MALRCVKHFALNSNAGQVLPQLVARNGVKGFAEVNKAGIQATVLVAGLHCFA